MTIIFLMKTFLRDMGRQRTIVFSSLILPLVIIWSTWWVTVEIPMIFNLDSGLVINASMLEVHVVTGGLTAMGITAGLFGFIITSDYQRISQRMKQVGYSSITINSGIFLALFSVLLIASIVAIILSSSLSNPSSITGLSISILLVTIIYAALGNLIGTIFPNITAGSLLILIFSFMDLMLFTNPMGEELYLQNWTYFIPGFWPVQIALESGFIGFPHEINLQMINGITYFLTLILFSFVAKRFKLTVEVK